MGHLLKKKKNQTKKLTQKKIPKADSIQDNLKHYKSSLKETNKSEDAEE